MLMKARNIIFLQNFHKILFFSIHFEPTDRPLFISEFARKPKDQLGVALAILFPIVSNVEFWMLVIIILSNTFVL